ncbi:MAG: ATP-dependent metallopeptidase FtsH/Yme1/Tma family protein [Sphingobacteriia bacterium]|nr:ATP-dependent metallopeptidase FtsH/Yme1/Tma family protein [Sphingobacteriia bacterium]
MAANQDNNFTPSKEKEKKTDSRKNNNPAGKPGDGNKKKFNFYWIYTVIAVIFFALFFFNRDGQIEEITWGDLRQMLLNQDVEKIVLVNREYAEIFIKEDKINDPRYDKLRERLSNNLTGTTPHFKMVIGSVETFEKDVQEEQEGISNPVYIRNEIRRNWTGDLLGWLLPLALLVGAWIFIMRMMSRGGPGGGQIFNIGKSKAQLFDKDTHVTITFKDVAGLEEAKVEVMEIVDFLKNPSKYTELGGKIPKGALLVGPPGTGKTLLAKSVAGEANVPFFSISGSDFVEMFVGVGASRVRDLFRQAKEKAPCIIFIDEIDAIGRARGRSALTGANDERENTLNQLLTEMDGFGTNAGVIILAATNRADILDRALLRAGRFDRQIHVELPDMEERKAIFLVHLKPIKFDDSVDIDGLAKQTPGFSGADIANVCNEAALIGARKGKKVVDKSDFMDAIDRIIGGLEKRNKIISQTEKKTIAYHEAGHATVSWLLEHGSPLVKVTIVPRGKALGAAWYLPEERQITTFEQMVDEMTATLGGRASEEVNFGVISTGALNDLERITKQAYAMISYFGLNKRIGNISYYDSSGQSEYSFTKPYSEKTAQIIDEEVQKLVQYAYSKAVQLLTEHKAQVDQLAQLLLEREVIYTEDMEHIFGKRQFKRDIERAEELAREKDRMKEKLDNLRAKINEKESESGENSSEKNDPSDQTHENPKTDNAD